MKGASETRLGGGRGRIGGLVNFPPPPPSTADPWEQMVVGAGAGMPLEATAGGRRQESPVFHW